MAISFVAKSVIFPVKPIRNSQQHVEARITTFCRSAATNSAGPRTCVHGRRAKKESVRSRPIGMDCWPWPGLSLWKDIGIVVDLWNTISIHSRHRNDRYMDQALLSKAHNGFRDLNSAPHGSREMAAPARTEIRNSRREDRVCLKETLDKCGKHNHDTNAGSTIHVTAYRDCYKRRMP